MGSLYGNLTLTNAEAQQVLSVLRSVGRDAAVLREQGSAVVVFDALVDVAGPVALADLGSLLTGQLGCAGLAVVNHDDDAIECTLFDRGSTAHHFVLSSAEGLGALSDDEAPQCSVTVCRVLGVPDRTPQVEAVLRSHMQYPLASLTHGALVAALGLPTVAVGWSHASLASGDLPDGMEEDDFFLTTEGDG